LHLTDLGDEPLRVLTALKAHPDYRHLEFGAAVQFLARVASEATKLMAERPRATKSA
jgi:hypothetical protein